MQEFELRVEPLDNNNFAIALCQRSYKKAGEKRRPQSKQIGKVQGQSLVCQDSGLEKGNKRRHS